MRGHSTAYNAGILGKEMGCKVVALNHFGNRSSEEEYVTRMVSEAREGNQNASQVIASYDFLEVWIPRGGFAFDSTRSNANDEKVEGASSEEDAIVEEDQETLSFSSLVSRSQ